MTSLKQHLITAPEDQLDKSMREFIEQNWHQEPTALELLEVLDKCIHFALASGLVIMVLETMLVSAMKAENTNMVELEKLATWRNEWN